MIKIRGRKNAGFRVRVCEYPGVLPSFCGGGATRPPRADAACSMQHAVRACERLALHFIRSTYFIYIIEYGTFLRERVQYEYT